MTGGTADGALTAARGNIDKEQLSYKKYAAVRRREKRKGMKKYRQIMLAGLLFSVALMGCSAATGGKQGETEDLLESSVEASAQEQMETGSAGEATILETDMAADEAGKDQTASAVLSWREVELPDTYFISYEVSDSAGVVRTISRARDAEGNIYYRTGEAELLFLMENGSYVRYDRADGGFVRQDGEKYRLSYVEELTKDFDEYLDKASLMTGGVSTLAGEEEIAGQTCDVYSVTVQFANFEQTFRYSVDQETGVCMRQESDKNISGVELDGAEGFSCVRFDTEQIDLRKEFTIDI